MDRAQDEVIFGRAKNGTMICLPRICKAEETCGAVLTDVGKLYYASRGLSALPRRASTSILDQIACCGILCTRFTPAHIGQVTFLLCRP
jgi:hypothetical protein